MLTQVREEIVVGVVAELGVLDEVVGQTGLPEETEVRIVGEFVGHLARVVQQGVEVVARAQAQVRVQLVRVADVSLCCDAERP